jgi:hypothetical protein
VSGLHYVFKPRLVVGTEYKVEYYDGRSSDDPPELLYYDFDRHGLRIAVRWVRMPLREVHSSWALGVFLDRHAPV